MLAILENVLAGTLEGWGVVEGVCALVLLVEALVLVRTQRGAQRQRRWAALGPLVGGILAAVIGWGFWTADRIVATAGLKCYAPGNDQCNNALAWLYGQARNDAIWLGWLFIALTVALTVVTSALVRSADRK